MEKHHITNNMTVVHNAFGENKPAPTFTEQKTSTFKTTDPSSAIRSDRYPVPESFQYRSEVPGRELVKK